MSRGHGVRLAGSDDDATLSVSASQASFLVYLEEVLISWNIIMIPRLEFDPQNGVRQQFFPADLHFGGQSKISDRKKAEG